MKKKEELPAVEPVKLKPVLGMRPGKFILICLIAALILLVFFLFCLPGIVKGGRYVSFTSDITNVGVIVDDVYLGSTSGTNVFVKSGSHQVEYIKNGITIYEGELEVDHPVFATLFARRSMEVEVTPASTEGLYASIKEDTLKSLVAYSAILTYPEGYNCPPVYSNYAKDVVALGLSDVSSDFYLFSLFVTSNELLADYEAALAILESNGVAYDSLDLETIRSVVNGDGSATNRAIVNPSSVATFRTSDGYYHYEGGVVTLGTNAVPSTKTMNTLPLTVEVGPFELSESLVSEYDYALFIAENPYWSKNNVDQLVTDGVADQYYLAGIYPSTSHISLSPIRNISYEAAVAYCQWLSEKTGETYRMPTEAEWYLASLSAPDSAYATSLISLARTADHPTALFGGLWEFTDTAYVPLSRLAGVDYNASALEACDVVLKGGSYINDPSSIDGNTVGVMTRSTTSDYAGLRLVREV